MSDFEIPDKTLLTSVDRAADSLLIYDDSASALKRTVVNNLLDLTTHPVGVDDVQTLTNKTLTTPTLTVNENVFTVQNNSDTTKKLQLRLSGITTGTTRTLTVPDANDTIVGLAATQTLTNKTLTSPTINTPTIVNPTLTTDAVAEYTAANGVAVDGLNIKDGKLNTNNSVVTANITDAAVTPAKLLAGTGTSWAMQTWTPTWTNLTVGNAVTNYGYVQIGKMVFIRVKLTFGSTTSISGDVSFTPPVTANSVVGTQGFIGFAVNLRDAGTSDFQAWAWFESTTSIRILISNVGSTYPSAAALSSTVPFTWTTNDVITLYGSYEAA